MKVSNHVQVAQNVRDALKEHFPGVKFSVTSAIYAGGNSVYVNYKDKKLKTEEVVKITEKFQSGFFDMQANQYNYYVNRPYPTVRYVLVSNLY